MHMVRVIHFMSDMSSLYSSPHYETYFMLKNDTSFTGQDPNIATNSIHSRTNQNAILTDNLDG